MTAPAKPGVLDYATTKARPGELVASAYPTWTPVLRWSLWLAISGGLCVMSALAASTGHYAAITAHVTIYLAALLIGLRRSALLSEMGVHDPVRVILDCVAAIALLVIAFAPVLMLDEAISGRPMDDLATSPVIFALLVLAATTYRHVRLYRSLAAPIRKAGRHEVARDFLLLGKMKAVYEALWLCLCVAPYMVEFFTRGPKHIFSPSLYIVGFLVIGALGGCLLFGIVWLMAIAVHSNAFKAANQRLRR